MTKFSPEQEAEIARLYEEKVTIREIAKRFHVYRENIRRSLIRSGVEIRSPYRFQSIPESDWTICTCGQRAIYNKKSLCRACYDKERNARPEVKDRQFIWKLKNLYHISLEEYNNLLRDQGGVCAICKKPDPRGTRLCIDHDHACCPGDQGSCGKCIRGLLCVKCNRALGYFDDSIENTENAASYLKKYAAN